MPPTGIRERGSFSSSAWTDLAGLRVAFHTGLLRARSSCSRTSANPWSFSSWLLLYSCFPCTSCDSTTECSTRTSGWDQLTG